MSYRSKIMEYYICVRNTIQKFDELLCKIAVEGGTLSLALLSFSGIFFRESFCLAAIIISAGSVFTTCCFVVMVRFYSKLLDVAVGTAKEIEDEIFPDTWNPSEDPLIIGKKLTHSIDMHVKLLGRRVAGKYTWIVIMLEFIILLILSFGLLLFYLYQYSLPVDC